MRLLPILALVLFARLAAAQSPDTTRRPPGSAVTGIVRDSIARVPLSGAVVQLVAADSLAPVGRTVISDSLGAFTIHDVSAGRYLLGFFHPMLDSLGLEPTVRNVSVDGRRPVRADLAIPSATSLRTAICGSRSEPGSGTVVGVVRDARDARARAPLSGVTVSVEWLELTFTTGALSRRVARAVATSAENGWFAVCNLPRAGIIALTARRGGDSTDRIEEQIPAERFLRRELYLGPARIVVTSDTTRPTDSLAPLLVRRRTGDGRLTGVVVTVVGDRPLPNATVSIPGGPRTRVNERGEWTLVGAPVGTRVLEVRAVGYYPERRAVDIVQGAPPIRTALLTMKAVLDTIRVTASRLNPNMREFEERRRRGAGRYVTAEDIARRRPMFTSDLLRMVPGLSVDRVSGESVIRMRGLFADRCSPAVYVDGHYMRILSADDIDSWVSPDEIAGIEIYSVSGLAAQFDPGMTGCGSIVIWTSPRMAPLTRLSWKARVVRVAGLAAVMLAIGTLVLDQQ